MQSSDISGYQHAHHFHSTGARAQSRTLRVVILTIIMMVVEIVAGWMFNSMALLADGWHMSTHAAALGIAWMAFMLARKHALDHRFVFGTWKIEILGGFTSAILLGITSIAMAGLSILRLLHPADIQFDQAIFVAVIGLIVNLVSIFLLGDGAIEHDHELGHSHGTAEEHVHENKVEGQKNLNLRAAYLHVVADALTSVLAIAALLGGKYLHWNWLDPVMGIVGSILIVQWTVQLLSQTSSILLDRETNDSTNRAVRLAIESDGDSRVSDLHVWRVGQERYACIVTIVASKPQLLAIYKDRLSRLEHIVHATVEIETFRQQEQKI